MCHCQLSAVNALDLSTKGTLRRDVYKTTSEIRTPVKADSAGLPYWSVDCIQHSS